MGGVDPLNHFGGQMGVPTAGAGRAVGFDGAEQFSDQHLVAAVQSVLQRAGLARGSEVPVIDPHLLPFEVGFFG